MTSPMLRRLRAETAAEAERAALQSRWEALPPRFRERCTLADWEGFKERYRQSVEAKARALTEAHVPGPGERYAECEDGPVGIA